MMNDWEQHIYKYNRKERSLSILCTKFLILYNREGVELIKLDDAALQLGLGIKKRRLYDFVNILEAVGVLKRKAKIKNQYTWKGLTAIPRALQDLKEEGLIENSTAFDGGAVPMMVPNDENNEEETSISNIGSQNEKSNRYFSTSVKSSTNGNRRDRTLAQLTQSFIKLFVCSNVDMISLDAAAKLLPGNDHKRTKARRIYDIVNILCSLNIIEKTYITSKTKPTFRWLGLEGKTQENQHSGKTCIEQTLNSNAKESERKMFGTDITNIVKRNKVDLFVKRDIEENSNIQSKQDNHSWQAKPEKKDAKETSSCPQFGPSDPAYMIKAKQPEKKVHDWESLAVYHRPLYQNQDLKILFSQYMEA